MMNDDDELIAPIEHAYYVIEGLLFSTGFQWEKYSKNDTF